jgi:hypothetical protein
MLVIENLTKVFEGERAKSIRARRGEEGGRAAGPCAPWTM